MLRHLLCLLREIGNLPFALNDKWSAEADLATVRAAALELANEETAIVNAELHRKRTALKTPASRAGQPVVHIRNGQKDPAVSLCGAAIGSREWYADDDVSESTCLKCRALAKVKR